MSELKLRNLTIRGMKDSNFEYIESVQKAREVLKDFPYEPDKEEERSKIILKVEEILTDYGLIFPNRMPSFVLGLLLGYAQGVLDCKNKVEEVTPE